MTSHHRLKVISVHHWTPTLFTFRVERPRSFRFEAGQFVRVGLEIGQSTVLRPYSIASPPWEDHLEFYSIVAPDGTLTPHLVTIQPGDHVIVEAKAAGYLTTGSRFKSGKHLWMLATGTGLAPFLSIVQDFYTYNHYDRLFVVHCVRHSNELAYREFFENGLVRDGETYLEDYASRVHYVPIVTREKTEPFGQRIPFYLRTGGLEKYLSTPFDAQTRFMACGNPQMIKDTRLALEERGYTLGTLRRPGEIVIENAF